MSELANHHYLAARIDYRAVHNPVFIVENAQVGNLLAQPFNVLLCVAVLDTDQYQHPVSYIGFELSVDCNGAMLYTLYNCSHLYVYFKPFINAFVLASPINSFNSSKLASRILFTLL